MTAPILIIAVGNESRGDDALAPLLLRRLGEWQAAHQADRIELLEDFQLQIEHAADLLDRELVLFVDAGIDTPAPFDFYRARDDGATITFSHALAPEAVLATYRQVYGVAPPPAFVLCLRGESFELGATLSEPARAHLEQSWDFIRNELLPDASLSSWEKQTGQIRLS